MSVPRGPLAHYVSVNNGVCLMILNHLGTLRQDAIDPVGFSLQVLAALRFTGANLTSLLQDTVSTPDRLCVCVCVCVL